MLHHYKEIRKDIGDWNQYGVREFAYCIRYVDRFVENVCNISLTRFWICVLDGEISICDRISRLYLLQIKNACLWTV